MLISIRGLMVVAVFGGMTILGGCSEPVQRIDSHNLTELADDPSLELQYMGSDGIYHYVDLPTREGHNSYKITRSAFTLEREFPVGGGARYRLTPAMMQKTE